MREPQLFPFRFAAAYRLPGLLFGVTDATTGVWIDDAVLRIKFGPWRVRTPLTNVISTTHTGPYSLFKTMGPAHLSFADRGLTCATNSERGLCVRFAKPVRGLDPVGLLRHPAVTVTVADCDGLAKELTSRFRGVATAVAEGVPIMARRARLCSVGLATGRAALGVVALLRPALAARPWVGRAQATAPAGVVLGRAAGGRDLALGAGALFAAWRGDERALRGWVLAGAFCDVVDVVATAVSWRDLPARGRLAVACAAGGGALLGGLSVVLAGRG